MLRLRILAQDVMVATERPKGLSALNILPGVIEEIRRDGVVVQESLALNEVVVSRGMQGGMIAARCLYDRIYLFLLVHRYYLSTVA